MLPIFEVFAIGSSGQTCSNIPSTRTSSIAIGILCGVAVVYLLVRRCRTFDSDSDSEADDEDDGGDANNTESIPLPEHFQCFVVAVVNTVAECEATVNILTKNCANFPVLGFYCRYADDNENGRSRVVQLQLSDHTGYCTLIRPHRMERIPDSLRQLLANRRILKTNIIAAVDPMFDYLQTDYNLRVAGLFDLRYASLRAGLPTDAEKLSIMAKENLDVDLMRLSPLDRPWWMRYWRPSVEDSSGPQQLPYAAMHARVSIDLYKQFAASFGSTADDLRSFMGSLVMYVDQRFRPL